MLQELGAAKGFDVDLWDQSWPAQSLNDTPFTSAANLAQYAVIIGDSSVGNNTFNAAYTMKDGTVVNERAAFKGYINNGGGYVALHAANDSMHTWSRGWVALVPEPPRRAVRQPPGQPDGFGTDCGSCYWVKVTTEDPSHPSTDASGEADEVAGRGRALPLRPQAAAVHPPADDAQRGRPTSARSASAPTRATSRAAITRSPGARTSTAAASGRRSWATTGSSSGPRRGSARASTRAS